MGAVFICHTLYHVLIALVRTLRGRPGRSTLVLSLCVPQADALRARLLDAAPELWDEILLVDEEKLDAQNSESSFYRLCRPGRRPYFVLPKGTVYISNDWSALGRYLQRERRVYTLCEDTFGGTLDPDQHLLDAQRAAPAGRYLYWGDSPCCRTVESEDAARCRIFGADKLVTLSKAQLLESLTDEEKAVVRAVFLREPLPENTAGATLLLPRSFVLDGLMEQPEQDAMFLAVAEKYCADPLFIKTHPRDSTDYGALFPHAVILPRTMPSEVLNFCLPFRFARAVTVQSWVLRGFTAAEEKVFVGLEDARALGAEKRARYGAP